MKISQNPLNLFIYCTALIIKKNVDNGQKDTKNTYLFSCKVTPSEDTEK